VQWVPNSTVANVSASPPLIPDGRISRVRLAAAAFPEEPSHAARGLSTHLHTPLGIQVISPARHPSNFTPLTRPSVRTVVHVSARHLPRAPLPAQGFTSYGVLSMHDIRERYPSFIAHTDSCARPKPSHCLDFTLGQWVYAGCCKSLLGVGPSQRYLRESFPRCLHPYPGSPPGAYTRFFPGDIGLRHVGTDSAHHKISIQRLPYGRFIGATVIPLCSGLQVCSPPRSLLPRHTLPARRAAMAFTSPHISVCYLPEQGIC